MKLPSPLLSFLVNFLLGTSWAIASLGAITLFSSFLNVGIVYAFLGALIGLIPGLFLVLIIEYIFMRQEVLNETKKQTKLLEELVSKS